MADRSRFGRYCSIELGDIQVLHTPDEPGLRQAFVISRDKTEIPNDAEISIWGLARATRERLEEQPELNCRVIAGYADDHGQIFYGVVQDIFSEKDGSDWVLRATAGDSEDKYNNSRVNLSFSAGTPVHSVLKKLVGATGVGAGNVGDLSGLTLNGANKIEKGFAVRGSAMFELQAFAQSIGLDWSVQDGVFVGAKLGEPYDGSGPRVSPGTGLIGSPRVDAKGIVTGECLLDPKLLPGVAFELESEKINGAYIANATTHSGDTHDDKDWTVGWDALPAGATSEGLLPEKD